MKKPGAKSIIMDDTWFDRFKKAQGKTSESYLLAHPGDIIVAEQLTCYPKAKNKFPNWHREKMIYTRLSLEQSSGEEAALFKSKLAKGKTIWDLTGGLGMDSLAFSFSFEHVHYCEPDKNPFNIAQHNHSIHGRTNIQYHPWTAEYALDQITKTDWIYLDPSRRDEKGKQFLLSECQPNVHEIISKITCKSDAFMIKLSPLYDIKQLFKELPMVNQVLVVSVGGEVKEILVISTPEQSPKVGAVLLPENLHFELNFELVNSLYETVQVKPPTKGMYLHIADPAVFKADIIQQIAENEHLNAWGRGGYVWSGKSHVDGFKSYEIIDVMDYKPKLLRRMLKGKKINIHKRNFPIEISSLYKALNSEMGDDFHLFFTEESGKNKRVCITTPPISISQS